MASLRDIRNRIGSVKNTRQITSAMKMVSAAKLRRATEAATGARPYAQTLSATLRRVAAAAGDVEHPLLAVRPARKVLLIVIGSDRGLCGGFNSNLNRRVEDQLRKWRSEGKEVELRTFGKKPRDFFRARAIANAEARVDLHPSKVAAEATDLAQRLATGFEAGEFDEVWLAYNLFKNTLAQIPTFAKVLPMALEKEGEAVAGPDYIYEPGGAQLLGALLPMSLKTTLLQAFLETEAGEQAARMTAMDNATRNATDLIAGLTLEYNRTRQAAITKELIEIISGAEAL